MPKNDVIPCRAGLHLLVCMPALAERPFLSQKASACPLSLRLFVFPALQISRRHRDLQRCYPLCYKQTKSASVQVWEGVPAGVVGGWLGGFSGHRLQESFK